MTKESNSKVYESITYEVIDGVGKITFNLPQYNNALNF